MFYFRCGVDTKAPICSQLRRSANIRSFRCSAAVSLSAKEADGFSLDRQGDDAPKRIFDTRSEVHGNQTA